MELPASLQGPGLELDEQSTNVAFDVFEVSLAWLQQALPNVRITIVHLPSVLSTYDLVGPSVTVETVDKNTTVHRAENVDSRSDEICRRLRHIALGSGVNFFDARPAMRALGKKKIIHGPRDCTHFNQVGYTRLGEAVAAALNEEEPPTDCGRLANSEDRDIMQPPE